MKKFINTVLALSLLTSIYGCNVENKNTFITTPIINNTFVKSNVNKVNKMNPWNDEIIYFVLTDRFYDGDKSNNFNVDKSNIKAYHGGDLQGLINKLDYIKDLGATAIWLTPVVDNRDNDFFGNWGYHGYWAKDLFKVDEHLGDMNKFKEFVNKAHSKGLKVLLDVVFNHVDYDHPIAKNRRDPKDKYYSWFNQYGDIKDYNDQWWLENGELGGLPDFNQSNPEVVKYLLNFAKFWIDNTGIDGFRVDTVKHVPKDFWKTLTNYIHNYKGSNFFILGEVLNGHIDYCAGYKNVGFDSIFDFPLYYAITRAFKYGQSMQEFGTVFSQDYKYDSPNLLSTFIDNHDVPRFVNDINNPTIKYRFMLALSFIMTVRGIPTIYYGNEIGLPGGEEPYNRMDMQWDKGDKDIFNHLKKLISIRKKYKALRHGTQLEMWSDNNVYAFTRILDNEEVIAVFNNGGNTSRNIPLRVESKLKDGTILTNLLRDNDTVTVTNRHVNIPIYLNEAKIYVVK